MKNSTENKKYLKYFTLKYYLLVDGVSFLLMLPIILFYTWLAIDITQDQLVLFMKYVCIAIGIGILDSWIVNWIEIAPVSRYFKKILSNETITDTEYDKARTRFFKLPYLRPVTSAILWILNLQIALVPITIFLDINFHQKLILWMGVPMCAIFGIIAFFPFIEALVQSYLNRGIFPMKGKKKYTLKISIFTKISAAIFAAAFLPSFALFIHLYNIVESYKISDNSVYIKILVLSVIVVVIASFFIIFFTKFLLDKIKMVISTLERIGKGDLDGDKQDFAVMDEITEISYAVYDMKENLKNARENLKDLNRNLEIKVEDRTRELNDAMEEMTVINQQLNNTNMELEEAHLKAQIDMNMAASVQASIFPKNPPQSGMWDIAFMFKPLVSVSGDFYDFYIRDSTVEGIAIFDVSGHGIASGLITMIAKTVFHRNFFLGVDMDLNTVLDKANKDLINEIGRVSNYLTGILLRFDYDTVEYVNAGHPDLLYKENTTGTTASVLLDGNPIRGHFLGFQGFEEPYESMKFKLNKDDVLLLYTDCLLEGNNSTDEPYTRERLINSFNNAPDGTAQEILDYIDNDFRCFVGTEQLHDDLTAIVVKRKR